MPRHAPEHANIQLFNHALQRLHKCPAAAAIQGDYRIAGARWRQPRARYQIQLSASFFSRRERTADLLQHIDQIFGFAVFEIEHLGRCCCGLA